MKNFASSYIETLEAETQFRLDQAAREARRFETAMATWELLFSEGQFKRAAAWWDSEIRPEIARAG